MTDNAAVETPATEEVVEKEPTQADVMAEAYDRLMKESDEPAQQAAPEAPEKPEEQEAPEAPEVEAPEAAKDDLPTDLPSGVRQHWGSIPETARDAILKSQRDMSSKLSQASRDLQAVGPLRDMIHKAARSDERIRQMTPAQIAQNVEVLFQASKALSEDPVKALRGLARQHNIDLAKLSEGQPAQKPGEAAQRDAQTIRQLQQTINGLNQKLQQVSDPQYLRSQYDQWNTENTVVGEIQKFASDKPHWQEVEQYLPTVIPVAKAKLGENAAPAEVLQEAYSMAINTFVPNARADQTRAGEQPAPEAPERVQTAVKAKSVNVKSEPGRKSAPRTQREAMSAVYDRMTGS